MPPLDDFPYPPSPAAVPDGLTDFSDSYRRRQRALLACLFLFVALYFSLLFGSLLTIVLSILFIKKLAAFSIPLIIVSGVVFVYLAKGLFKRQDPFDPGLALEIGPTDHPKLFAFIDRICDEVGAERPRKVYLTPDVNAAVIIRSSFINLLVRPKKDLVIGLGLVNALNLSEFKAAMAHEFGHFSQSGWVSSYFTAAARICDDLVLGRDWFDTSIDQLKEAPHPIFKLVGYTVGGGVWLIKAPVGLFYRLIDGQLFAVKREREFHADLVAAAVAGSNAIVHGLYRLDFATETYNQTHTDLLKAADHKLFTADLYYHMQLASDILRKKKRDPFRGQPPTLDAPEEGIRVQVFDAEKGTDPADDGDYHPHNHDREENVKERFVAAVDDTRSAWILFDEPVDLRERITYKMYRAGKKVRKGDALDDPKVVQKFIDDEHAETTYDERYQGAYDDRMISPGDLDALDRLIKNEPWDPARLAAVHAKLYADLRGKADERKELSDELDKVLNSSEGARSKRSRKIVRDLEAQLEDFDKWFDSLDRRVYLVHIQMAKFVDPNLHLDLTNRYRFHLAVQGIFKVARDQCRKVHFYLSLASSQEKLHPDDFTETMHVLREARRALKKILREADEIDMPAMKNFAVGTRLGGFLLKKEIVREFPETYVRGDHVGKLIDQLDEVRAKAARLHFKSLGGILALQEKIAAAFVGAVNAVPAPVAKVVVPIATITPTIVAAIPTTPVSGEEVIDLGSVESVS